MFKVCITLISLAVKRHRETKLSSKNRFDLDLERLATTDEEGHRVYLYPEDVEGKWKIRRTFVYWILIVLYLVIPWININGKPSLMLNIFTREFTFMGFTLYGVEPILVFLVVISSLFFIAFLTSVFGRVWCGWGCPQTVFIHTIFAKLETFIEGSARTRKARDDGPWSADKIFRKAFKWLMFSIVTLHISHTFLGYFVGPRELLKMSMHSPGANLEIFSAVIILWIILLLDFGWFREQFCIIACPYGRMQSVLMDENSLIVAYDVKRGEPRRGSTEKENEGDCINCYACVKVCPTGIDIRRGTQLECIACTNCIDACDEIMDKVKKPQGLIRYSTELELQGKTQEKKKINFRSIAYLAICLLFVTSFFYFLKEESKLNYVFMRGTTPFSLSKTSNGKEVVLNNFIVKISHQGEKTYSINFKVHDPILLEKVEIITQMNPLKLNSAEVKTMIFFRFDPAILINGSKTILMDSLEDNKIISSTEVVLVGPNK